MMIKSLYNSVAGMFTQNRIIQTHADNLSNTETEGFKKALNVGNFYSNVDDVSKDILTESYYDFTQGDLQESENYLDVALDGEGFYRVQIGDDTTGYTRFSHFGVSTDGYLITNEGLPILALNTDTNQYEEVFVGNSTFEVFSNGSFSVNGNSYNFDVASFDDLQQLERVGDNVFRTEQAEITGLNTIYNQGFIEKSNIELNSEYTSLMIANRSFQSNYTAFQSVDESLQKAIEEVGKVG